MEELGPRAGDAARCEDWRARIAWGEFRSLERYIYLDTAILELLEPEHPERFSEGQLPTLQRRIRDW